MNNFTLNQFNELCEVTNELKNEMVTSVRALQKPPAKLLKIAESLDATMAKVWQAKTSEDPDRFKQIQKHLQPTIRLISNYLNPFKTRRPDIINLEKAKATLPIEASLDTTYEALTYLSKLAGDLHPQAIVEQQDSSKCIPKITFRSRIIKFPGVEQSNVRR